MAPSALISQNSLLFLGWANFRLSGMLTMALMASLSQFTCSTLCYEHLLPLLAQFPHFVQVLIADAGANILPDALSNVRLFCFNERDRGLVDWQTLW